MPSSSVTISRKLLGGLLMVVAGSLFLGGWGLGVLTTHVPPSRSASGTARSGSQPSTPSPVSNPFVAGTMFPFQQTTVDTLSGHPTHLAQGTKATVVMAMASWCLFCGYEDKWVWPTIAKTHGVVIDVVDVSPQGGIANPGPVSPPFHGADGVGGALSVSGMEATMRQYVHTYGLLGSPAIHVYVAPTAVQQAWHVAAFPSIAFVSASGTVTVAPPGAITLPQARTALAETMGHALS
ncbi:hypothetical protein [Sulfobacillus thermosulfidooxidans]|uniref:hypothetical protein n=1 Tax=Sulfobacillus thermosulfidooxidans TaxID=28034 RepID=UPI0006B666BF|nr:hypothetical protein [Sulfobacillus thermosulfidooxidans]